MDKVPEDLGNVLEETVENAKEVYENYEISNKNLKGEVENLKNPDSEVFRLHVKAYEAGENTFALKILKSLRDWMNKVKLLKDHDVTDDQIRIIEETRTPLGEFDSFIHLRDKLREVKNRAEEIYENRESNGHGMKHHQQVAKFSHILGKDQGLWDDELELLLSTAYLHDVKRGSDFRDGPEKSAERAGEILRDVGFREDKVEISKEGILNHTEGGSEYWLGKLLFDGDKLEFLNPRSFEERIPDFARVSDYSIEELKRLGVEEGLKKIYNTELARKLAIYQAKEVEEILPEYFDNERKVGFIEKNEYSEGARELERRLVGVQ